LAHLDSTVADRIETDSNVTDRSTDSSERDRIGTAARRSAPAILYPATLFLAAERSMDVNHLSRWSDGQRRGSVPVR
jgi:hypothetical protein